VVSSESHRGRGRSPDPALDMSDASQESGGAGSTAKGTARSPIRAACKLKKRQPPVSVEDMEPSKSEDSEDGAICPQKRAALGTACNPRVAREPSHKLERQPPAGFIAYHHHKRRREEVFTSLDDKLTSSERDTDPTD
jgi:hypothetical protein